MTNIRILADNVAGKSAYAYEMGYRPDIDGLRAVAVISVVLFHLGLTTVSGGFVGVDVFFVISGFLITSIVIKSVSSGHYSIAQFYERRIRRIIPAYAVVMAVCLACSALIMLPDDFKSLGGGVASSALFVSNMFFWSESNDYFNGAPELKPVLHTWSLSVEEQFYIVFPIVLAVLYRLRMWRFAGPISIVAFFASFVVSVWGVDNTPVAAFYLMPARAWEILAGSIIAFGMLPVSKNEIVASIEGVVGLCLIAVAVFTFNERTAFPGWSATLPVLGTVMVLHAGMSANGFAGRILAIPPVRFLGLISYSLYLWHWPVIVLIKYYFVDEFHGETAVLFLVSLVLAYLSWRFVESPFRGNLSIARGVWFGATTVLLLCFVGTGYAIYVTDGIPGRVPDKIRIMADKRTYQGPSRECGYVFAQHRDITSICALGATNKIPDFVVTGDSHAIAVAGSIFSAAAGAGRSGLLVSDNGYRPFIGFVKKGEEGKYKYINKLLVDVLDNNSQIVDVIVPIYWRQAVSVDSYRDAVSSEVDGKLAAEQGLTELVTRYPQKRFLFLLSPPNSSLFGGAPLARATWFGREFSPRISRERFDDIANVYRPVAEKLGTFENVRFLDLAAKFCDTLACDGLLDGRLAFSDDNHLSYEATLAFEPDFRTFLLSNQ